MAWIVHPDLPGQETEVPDQSVSMWSLAGWVPMDEPPKPPPPAGTVRKVTFEDVPVTDSPPDTQSTGTNDDSGAETAGSKGPAPAKSRTQKGSAS